MTERSSDNFVKYKGDLLMSGSKAFELYKQYQKTKDPKDQKALDNHMKELDQKAKELMERYK